MSRDGEERGTERVVDGCRCRSRRATRQITYACTRCGVRVTEARPPGPVPWYCASCKQEREGERIVARRDAARERMRRLRDRRRQEDRDRADRWPAIF